MIIGIVLHPYGEDAPAGLGRIILEFTKWMVANDSDNSYLIFLKEKPKSPLPFSPGRWKMEVLGPGYFWLDRLRYASKADVYIFNTPVMPLFYRPRKSIVVALDFAYKYFHDKGIGGFFYSIILGWYHNFSLHRADVIVAISESTKKDTSSIFGVSEEKIRVIYPGFTNICMLPKEKLSLPEKYFLFVGVLKERKNVFGVVRAFSEFHKKHNNYSLIITGKAKGSYADAVRVYIKETGLDNKVIFQGYLTDHELAYLYQNAEALVFPSFIEGFGFPVLEAMSCGTPVITSDYSSLMEISRDAALLVNPYNIGEIVSAMERVATDEKLHFELQEKGYRRTQDFSWEKAGKEYLSLIASL